MCENYLEHSSFYSTKRSKSRGSINKHQNFASQNEEGGGRDGGSKRVANLGTGGDEALSCSLSEQKQAPINFEALYIWGTFATAATTTFNMNHWSQGPMETALGESVE